MPKKKNSGDGEDMLDEAPAPAKPSKASAAANAADDEVLLTKEGLEKLKEELHNLTKVRRKEVADRLKEAISYGDLSENSEYEQAKYDQAFVEGRISELEAKIKHAKVIEGDSGSTTMQIGSTVRVKNLDENEDETYTIVGSTESDPVKGKISNESPVGRALLGKKEGAEVTVKVPAGEVHYRVLTIT